MNLPNESTIPVEVYIIFRFVVRFFFKKKFVFQHQAPITNTNNAFCNSYFKLLKKKVNKKFKKRGFIQIGKHDTAILE